MSVKIETTQGRNVAAMGRELGVLYTALVEDLTWVCIGWGQYRKLFVDDSADLELLNRTAPFFFWFVQRTLLEDTILAITRLVAPPKSAGKSNLSIRRLPALVDDHALRAAVEADIGLIESEIAFAVDWRNRRLAHRDLALSTDRHAMPLPPAKIDALDRLLNRIAKVVNRISRHYLRSETAFRHASIIHDAEELAFYLRAGVRRDDLRQQRLEAGHYNPEDWDDTTQNA